MRNLISMSGSVQKLWFFFMMIIYLLTEIGLSPGGSTHLHTNNT